LQAHGYQLSFYYFKVPAIEYNFHHMIFIIMSTVL
jgi:hypothetical protein